MANFNAKYPPETRAKALELATQGKSNVEIAKELKVGDAIVGYWRKAELKKVQGAKAAPRTVSPARKALTTMPVAAARKTRPVQAPAARRGRPPGNLSKAPARPSGVESPTDRVLSRLINNVVRAGRYDLLQGLSEE